MIDTFDVFKDESNGCFQLRTKTNAYALEFDDPEKEQIFLKIVDDIQKNPGISLQKIYSFFSGKSERKSNRSIKYAQRTCFPSFLSLHGNEQRYFGH
jgi:Ca2+-binding EF-hand superfamily protein